MISVEMDYNFQIAVYKSSFFDASLNFVRMLVEIENKGVVCINTIYDNPHKHLS